MNLLAWLAWLAGAFQRAETVAHSTGLKKQQREHNSIEEHQQSDLVELRSERERTEEVFLRTAANWPFEVRQSVRDCLGNARELASDFLKEALHLVLPTYYVFC